MIFGLLIIGLILIASALKNTQHELGQQLQTDMLGSNGFFAWTLAILGVGSVGYLPGLRQPSRYLLALLGVVIVLRNGGAWANAQAAILSASKAGPAPSIPAPSLSPAAASSGAG